MAQVTADLEAIKQFRQALLTFAGRMHELLSTVDVEIDRAQQTLGWAEDRTRQDVRSLTDELYRCRAAAAQGYQVDCSSIYYALQEAEEHLGRVVEVKRRFQDTLRWYSSVRNRLEKTLTWELSHGVAFLDRRISALEAYHATMLLSTAAAVAGAGVLGLMGGVSAALRKSEAGIKKALGNTGEEIAAVVLSRHFGLKEAPFTQPAHGFDRVFSAPGLPVIVVESKISSSGKLRLGHTSTGEQGSSDWIADKAERMTDPASAQWSPANERIASLIRDMGAENVPSLTVVTDPAQRTADVYVRQADGGWQLLEGGIDLAEIEAEMQLDAGDL